MNNAIRHVLFRKCQKDSLNESLKRALMTRAARQYQRLQTLLCLGVGLMGIRIAVELSTPLHHWPILVPHLHIVLPSGGGAGVERGWGREGETLGYVVILVVSTQLYTPMLHAVHNQHTCTPPTHTQHSQVTPLQSPQLTTLTHKHTHLVAFL